MYRMGLMAMVLESPNLDMNRCGQMALVHDLAESIVGDITPWCGIDKEEKHRLELVFASNV
jgi:putative hydrolase of HD superfamily